MKYNMGRAPLGGGPQLEYKKKGVSMIDYWSGYCAGRQELYFSLCSTVAYGTKYLFPTPIP